jgi:hypothetical protein
MTERDRRTLRRIVSKNHRTTAAQVTGQQNWIFILKTLFQQKLSDVSFTNPTSTVWLKLLNLWLLKVMLSCINDCITTIKSGHQDNWKHPRDVVGWVVLHAVPHIRKSLRLVKTQGSLQSGMPGSNSETGGGSVMVWAVISWYSILLAPLLPIMA